MMQICCSFETNKPEVQVYTPADGQFGVACALPEKEALDTDKYLDLVEKAITALRTHTDMLKGVAEIIGKVADIDDTVHYDIQAVNIF